MKLLDYFRDRRWFCLLLLAQWALLAAMFALYHLPMKAVYYPVILCLAVLAVFFGVDLRRWKQKRLALQHFLDQKLDALQETADSTEQDYQKIILSLMRQQRALEADRQRRLRDLTDYYTLWAHQIKTPIASMTLALQNDSTAQSRRLRGELRRVEQYVEMALVYLNLEDGGADLVLRECDLDEIVKKALRRFASEFIDRKLRLEYQPLNAVVLTDEKWLGFMLEQVISNALKYTASGSISIYLENETLCVQDTGPGIAASDLPRIFEKGFTGYQGRENQTASGIGLYLCGQLCRKLGHRIWADSAPGQGTTIRFDLSRQALDTE